MSGKRKKKKKKKNKRWNYTFANARSTTKCGTCKNIYICDVRVDTCKTCGGWLHEEQRLCNDCAVGCMCLCGHPGVPNADDY